MKSLVSLATLVLLAVAVGCGGNRTPSDASQSSIASDTSQSSSNVSGIPVVTNPGWIGQEDVTPTLAALDKEGIQLAIDFWKPMKLRDSYYLHIIRRSQDPKCPNKGRAVIQLRHVSINFLPQRIDEAQKLNGIEWKADVYLRYEAACFFVLERLAEPRLGSGYDPPRAPDTTWSQWCSAAHSPPMHVRRVNGKWESVPETELNGTLINGVDIGRPGRCFDDAFETVDPSAIPK